MASEKNARKTRVFISYSRKNLPFVRKLNEALDSAGMDAWVDWEGIPPSADWMEEIKSAIQGADALLFVVSPFSLKSKVCNEELELGIKYQKKIIPVLFAEPGAESSLHPKLASTNWVRMRSKIDDFNEGIAKLLESIQTDLEWVQRHTRLLQRSTEWSEKKRNYSYLLQGSEIEESERWMAEATAGGGRKVLPLQAEYVNDSRKMAVRRQRILTFIIGAAFLISALLGVYASEQRKDAEASARDAEARAREANISAQNAIESRSTAIANEWERARQEEIAKENEQIAKAQRSASEAWIYQDKAGELDVSTLLAVDAYQKLSKISNQRLWSSLIQAENILRHNISLLAEPVQQMNTGASIWDIVMSADRKKFVTVDLGGHACAWDTNNGAQLFCAQNDGAVYDAVFSKDDKVLVTGSDNGEITFWDAITGAKLKTLSFNGSVWDLALSPDGRWLGAGISERASLIDMRDMQEQLYFSRPSEVNAVAFDPSGRYLALGAADGYVSIWMLEGGWRAGPRHKNEVTDLTFSPDGAWLISAGMDSAARATKISDGGQKYSILHDDWVENVAFGPDPAWFVTASDDNFVRVIDTATGQERMRMAHADFVAQARVSPDGRWIASTGSDRTARVWDSASGAEVLQIPIGGIGASIQFNMDASRLIVGDEQGNITLWDISRLKMYANSIRFPYVVDEARFSPDGKWLALNSDDNAIRLIASDALNDSSGKDRKPLASTKGQTSSITVSADSKWIAALEFDWENENYNRVVVINAAGAESFTLENDGAVIQALAFMPDNKLAVAYQNGAIFIWDLTSREKTLFQQVDEHIVLSIAVAPDGKYLAAGLEEANSTLAWDVAPLNAGGVAAHKQSSLPQAGKIAAIQFSPDGKLLATGSSEGTVYLWSTASDSFSKRLGEFSVNGAVSSMEISPDNRFLAVGDSAGSVYLIDLALGQEITRMPHANTVTSISFSPDGKQLAAVSHKSMLLWDLSSIQPVKRDRLTEIACSRLIKNFTPTKWELLFFDEEYRLICPNLPAGKN